MADGLELRVKQLEDDLGRVALIARALMDAVVKKGLLTQVELAQAMSSADSADGARDGKLDMSSFRMKPPPK
jgi:hypothetical protein